MLPVDKVEGVNPEVSGDFGPGAVNKVYPVLPGHGLDAEAGKVNTGDHEGTLSRQDKQQQW